VIWSYFSFAVVLAIGLVAIFVRGDWQKARGFDKLILFGPLFYAAPMAAFGTEHFTLTKAFASLIPAWIPWHLFWTYFVGTCFILAALSLVTRIQTRLSASLLALTFLLFVVLMDTPAWTRHPRDRFALTFALRELSFSGGPLALAASLTGQWRERGTHILVTIGRYFVAIPVLFFSFEQFLHGDHVPGVPLEPLTPAWIFGHSVWTYLAAVAYAVTGTLLLMGIKTRAAATWLGLTVLFVELVIYVPIGVVERANLDNGLNYLADTLLFCGTVLLLAGAMPRETERRESSADPWSRRNQARASHASANGNRIELIDNVAIMLVAFFWLIKFTAIGCPIGSECIRPAVLSYFLKNSKRVLCWNHDDDIKPAETLGLVTACTFQDQIGVAAVL
jgi:uncharacterized membrane protein